MTDKTMRVFEIDGNTAFFVRVHAQLGNGRSDKCKFAENGEITNLPKSSLWTGLRSKDDVKARREDLVQAFLIEIGHQADQNIVVAQRGGRHNRYVAPSSSAFRGELQSYSLPPCGVSYWTRSRDEMEKFSAGPIGVWTDPMNKGGCNRADIWYIGLDGFVKLYCVYLVTLDDGATFRLVGQTRWEGHVFKRPEKVEYRLRTDDKRIQKLYELNEHVRTMLGTYVFQPGDDSENFEARAQILQDDGFRQLIIEAETPLWKGASEDFWLDRKPNVTLSPNQGYVKFLTYGVGRGSFGIVVGADGKEYQFDHQTVVGRLEDDQRIIFIPPGTIVDIVGDPVTKVEGNPQPFKPAKLRRVVPQFMPVPIDPTQITSKTAA